MYLQHAIMCDVKCNLKLKSNNTRHGLGTDQYQQRLTVTKSLQNVSDFWKTSCLHIM